MRDPLGSRDVHLLLCRLIGPQHRHPCPLRHCIYITVQSLLHHPSAQGLCPVDWVFVIEPPLPAPSLSPAHRPPPRVVAEPCSLTRLLPHCFFVQLNHAVSVTISSPPTSSTRQQHDAPSTSLLCTPQPSSRPSLPIPQTPWLGPSTLYVQY
jgi:hypothetical protein